MIKLNHKKEYVMQWHTQAGNITTNMEVKIDFTIPGLSATKIVTWDCHVDGSAKVRYDMILGRDLLTELVLNLTLSENVIYADDGSSKGLTAPMVDLGMYELKNLNIGKTTPEESFMNAYAKVIKYTHNTYDRGTQNIPSEDTLFYLQKRSRTAVSMTENNGAFWVRAHTL